jgi:2',3'-cyclic-nucleotide 2'-phosphodiesterase/3'-nucleotidase
MYLKDFFTWFPYENSMCIIRMTGNEIVKYLEYSYENATSVINFDTAAGIIYTVHKERPAGNRIEVHRMADGTAFIPRRRYYVVMNSYRVLGGGGHLTQGMGWTREQIENRIVWESQLDMRRMFMDRERSRSPFTAVTLNHWQYK